MLNSNIPILPEAFLTFASKSSVGPSYAANRQEDHKKYFPNEVVLTESGTDWMTDWLNNGET